jgi:polyferredoxin
MSMVFCRGCAKEIHETAVACPSCGASQSILAPPENGRIVYTSYDQVPWYRKEWFAWLSFHIFTPALVVVVLLTGVSYYTRKGQLKTVSKGMKIFFIVSAVLYMLAVFGKANTESYQTLGKELKFNGGQLFYTSAVTKDEAE